MPGIREEMMVFLAAVVSGAIVRLVYQCIRCFRRIVSHTLAAIGAEDLIFWLGSAVYLFVQIYHTSDGSIRWYFVLGVVLGVAFMWVFLDREEKLFKKIYGRKQESYRQGLDKKEEKSDLKLEPPKEERTLDRDLERIEISKGAMTVIDVLHNEGYNADLVGGCVRDAMLGMKPKDEDITTNLEPDKVTSLFEREGYQVIPTGIEHGTVTVMVPNDEGKLEGYEITTYRIDGEYKDGRHPDGVSFTDDIKEDLSRRDFTINAIAYDPRGEGENRIKDPFNGRDDIKNGVIRAVGDPRERIKEDALRMMRAVRFSAQKDMEIDKDLKSAIKERAAVIDAVRTKKEQKILEMSQKKE